MKILLKLFSLRFIGSIFGLASSIITVKYFGVTRSIEVFFAAQSLVYLVTSLTQSGQLAEIFLPEYNRLNNISKKLGFQALNVVINFFSFWIFGVIIIIFIFSDFFIEIIIPGFSQSEKNQATLIFRVLLPYLVLQLYNSFFITVLNAEKKFGRAEILSLINPIVTILSLVVLYEYFQIWALVFSVLLGKTIEFVFYFWQLYKIGYKYKFLLSINEFDHKSFFKTMSSTFFYVGATQFYLVILTAGTSFLPEGTFAIFKYVQGLSNKIKGLFIQPFLTIFFTTYSLLINSMKDVKKEFQRYFDGIINVNTIVIIGSIIIGDVIITLIWGGEKFSDTNVYRSYQFLVFNIISILFISIGSIYRKMAIAHGKGYELYSKWTIAQLISSGICYFLLKEFGVFGLMFIIPLNSLFMGIVSYWVYFKTNQSIRYNIFNKNIFFSILLVLIACLIKLNFWNSLNYLAYGIVISFVLSLYPLTYIYKIFKK